MKKLIILSLLLIGLPCIATNYKLYYPQNLKNIEIRESIGSGVLMMQVSGTENGRHVIYDCHYPRMEREQTNKIIAIPNGTDHIYIIKE